MQAKELREMSVEYLNTKSLELRDEIAHLRLKRATSQSENPMKLRDTKRDLARVETVLRQKALRAQEGAA